MPSFLPDTSCMVAAVCSWHEHHGHARNEVELRLSRGETMVVAAPALVETYAVLTRLPPPYRLSAGDSLTLIETNFTGVGEVVALDGSAYHALLCDALADGVTGGQIYDAVIAACARIAGISTLLTFNERHFLPFATSIMEIVVPEQGEH